MIDRRDFLKRAGLMAAAAGVGAVAPAAPARAGAAPGGEPPAAPVPGSAASGGAGAARVPVRVAQLRGSASLSSLASSAAANPAHWVAWKAGPAGGPRAAGPKDVRVLDLRRGSTGPGFARLDVLARFTVNGVTEPVEFFAWSYVRDRVGRNSPPVGFSALAAGSAELLLDVWVDGQVPGSGAGRRRLPIGGAGLGDGVYALLSPRAGSGSLPNPRTLACTGDPAAPLARIDGAALDFDHLIVTIGPAAA